MRLFVAIVALAVAVPIGLCAAAASAQPFQGQTWWGGRPNAPPGAWCLNSTSNSDKVDEDCSFATFADCQRALVNPNSGFCTQTGYGVPPPPPAPPRRQKRGAQR